MFGNASEIFSLIRVERVARLEIDDIVGVGRANGRVDESIVDEIADNLEHFSIGRARELELETGSQHFGDVSQTISKSKRNHTHSKNK